MNWPIPTRKTKTLLALFGCLFALFSIEARAKTAFEPTAAECARLFGYTPEVMTQIFDPLREFAAVRSLLGSVEGYRFEFLGSGAAGRVYRVHSMEAASEPFIVKTQFSRAIAQEAAGFQILAALPTRSGIRFASPKVDWKSVVYGNREIRVAARSNDVRGTPLFRVLADPQLGFAEKMALREKYMRLLNDFRAHFSNGPGVRIEKPKTDIAYFHSEEAHYRGSSFTLERAVSFQPEILEAFITIDAVEKSLSPELSGFLDFMKANGDPIRIILKTDNILVTPQGELVLIDPI